ncbi:hypothetical protein ACFL3C_04970 [Patescibacteria group bacterium]
MNQTNTNSDDDKARLLKKLELLEKHQKMEQVIAKESDKLEEGAASEKDQEKITQIKQNLTK